MASTQLNEVALLMCDIEVYMYIVITEMFTLFLIGFELMLINAKLTRVLQSTYPARSICTDLVSETF